VDLPVENVYQQKIAFDDKKGVIPRRQPFSIDLDEFEFDWTDEEREFLSEDKETAWLTARLPGGAHCRPEGGDKGSWVKLGWAFNHDVSDPQQDLANEPQMHPQYPEIVMRAATRLNIRNTPRSSCGLPRDSIHHCEHTRMNFRLASRTTVATIR